MENQNEKSIPSSFITMFGLVFRMGIGIKSLLLWKPNSPLVMILIRLFYMGIVIDPHFHPIFIPIPKPNLSGMFM